MIPEPTNNRKKFRDKYLQNWVMEVNPRSLSRAGGWVAVSYGASEAKMGIGIRVERTHSQKRDSYPNA